MSIPPILDFAHQLVHRTVEPGEVVVDATVGTGQDTVSLAEQVGPTGRVVGFDVQAEAIRQTRHRVEEEIPAANLELFQAGHETMASHLEATVHGEVAAVMFNLGYLPGGDSSITTEPETTRHALEAAAELLRPGGVMTIVAYTGHEGGDEEATAVADWAAALSTTAFLVLSYRFVNQNNDPPRLYAVEKRERQA